MSNATATITYRKTKRGEWVAFGPAALIAPGRSVIIVKKDGTTRMEAIESVGRTFDVDGVEMVYGYIDQAQSVPLNSRAVRTSHRRSGRYLCDECGDYVDAGTSCWETGHTH